MLGACGGNSNRPAESGCSRGPDDEVERAVKTAAVGVKTGAETGVEGVKTAGAAVGGFVQGGSTEASERWNDGKQSTRATAREGASDVSATAQAPDCD
jgi:hypothetical protein